MNRILVVGSTALLTLGFASAQKNASQATVPIYDVTVVERGVDAVNYDYRSAPTKIDFRGTVLLPDAKGEATVQSRRGRTEIEARFENLLAPARFGSQFLTYVLWALSPEGSVHNLGEILPDSDNRARLRVTTDLQTFGLIVTAEPYASVAQPSDVVTLKNKVRPDTVGKVEPIQPKFELMPRGRYTWQVVDNPAAQAPQGRKVSMDRYEAILELYQAQNAVAIARAAGADQYAASTLERAQANLNEAQQLQAKKGRAKLVVQAAREAAQAAEDARVISERRKQEEQLSGTRQKGAPAGNAVAAAPAVIVSPADEPAIAAPGSGAATTGVSPRQLLDQLSRILPVQDTARGLVMVLPPQSFDGVALRPEAAKQLAALAMAVSPQSEYAVQLEGHAGSGESGNLYRERAQNVRDALVASGLGPTQVSVKEPSTGSGVAGESSYPGVELIISGRSTVLGASAQ